MSEASVNPGSIQSDSHPQPEHMQCMEVWGGNTAVDKWFEMPGLTAWVYSQPHGDVYGWGRCLLPFFMRFRAYHSNTSGRR